MKASQILDEMKASQILICPTCETEVKLDKLEGFCPAITLCPTCKKNRRGIALVLLEKYENDKRTEELRKHLYCRDCGHIGLIEDFSFDFPNEESKESHCPKCHSDECVNMGSVTMCKLCDERPAEKNDTWCGECISDLDVLLHA